MKGVNRVKQGAIGLGKTAVDKVSKRSNDLEFLIIFVSFFLSIAAFFLPFGEYEKTVTETNNNGEECVIWEGQIVSLFGKLCGEELTDFPNGEKIQTLKFVHIINIVLVTLLLAFTYKKNVDETLQERVKHTKLKYAQGLWYGAHTILGIAILSLGADFQVYTEEGLSKSVGFYISLGLFITFASGTLWEMYQNCSCDIPAGGDSSYGSGNSKVAPQSHVITTDF